VALEYAEQTLERQDQLNRNNVVSAQELDQARSQHELAKAGVREAEEDQRLARLELARARQALGLRSIKSPIDGVVIKREFEAGEYADTRAILELAQIDPLYVEVFAPVGMLGRVAPGMIADVMPEQPVGGSYPATVLVVDPVIDAASGTFGVRLELPNPDHALPAGLNCRVRFGPPPEPLAEEPIEPRPELHAEPPIAPDWASESPPAGDPLAAPGEGMEMVPTFGLEEAVEIAAPAYLGACEEPRSCAEDARLEPAAWLAWTTDPGTTPLAQPVADEAAAAPVELPDVAASPLAETVHAPVEIEVRPGRVRRAVFTQDVVDREPVDAVDRVPNAQRRVFFFTELRGLQGETVTHRWEYGGEVRAVMPFAVDGARWRVYSLMEMAPTWLGEWTVAVVDGSGEVLQTAHFEYVDDGGAGEVAVE
jgi:hypothetical protein